VIAAAVRYREAVTAALAGGARVASLYASRDGDEPVVRALLEQDGDVHAETCAVRDGAVPTLVDLAPTVAWPEREAHDLAGVRFDGHEPLRPLLDHAAPLRAWTVPVRGADAYQVAVGPIHAGVIESGHFRFHVVGDRVLHLDARLGYKHRGLERAAEGVPLDAGIALAARACAACAVTNRIAYAHAVEALRGQRPTADVSRTRTVLLELERLWNHLNDVAAVCAGVGLAAGNHRFAALTEEARRLNARVAGHRFLFGAVEVGGSALALDATAVRTAREEVLRLAAAARRGLRELAFAASFQDRLGGVGILTTADAVRLGAVGPAARAAGVAEDVRATDELLAYDDFTPALAPEPSGDVRARLDQRGVEVEQTAAVLATLLERPLQPAACAVAGSPRRIAAARVESPRGATTCAVERDGDRVGRLHLRTGSAVNWPVLTHVVPGNLLPDFPLVNKSFELCYACVDR
jgi:Ni,Fe-hydrogenase III large subunit